MGEITWTPGIGDPTLIGWVTVFAYFASALVCLQAFMSEKSGPRRAYLPTALALLRVVRRNWPRVPAPARRASIWLALATMMTLLGVNKQLDVQTLFTQLGRVWARQSGWYESRHDVQIVFVLVLCLAAVGVVSLLWMLLRNSPAEFRVALSGFTFLLTFIVIRAASFHRMDALIGSSLFGVRMNGVLELTGIALVGFGAWRRMQKLSA